MSLEKEVVVFIPGFNFESNEKGFYLNLLADGLTECLEEMQVQEIGEAKIAGHSGKRFQVNLDKTNVKYVDIYEVFWLDLLNKLSEAELKQRIIGGTYLFFYWIFSRIWLSSRKYPFLFISFTVSMFLLLFWYYGIIAMALTAIGKDPEVFGFKINHEWAQSLGNFGTSMGGWSIWLAISTLMSFLPINKGIDMAYFTMRYLEQDTEGRILRAKIRKRVAVLLNDLIAENTYTNITILAHSMGATIGIDFLADYNHSTSKPIRYITIGGSLAILSYRSQWIEEEIKRCLENERVVSWIDYYSDQDWLCAKTPVPKSCRLIKIKSEKNTLKFDLLKQLTGKTHNSYFTDDRVLKKLLES